VTREISWPKRFRVILHVRTGGSIPFSVVTWISQNKAISIAVAAYMRRYPEGAEIYDVEIDDLGRISRDAEGLMVISRSDLTDRSEF